MADEVRTSRGRSLPKNDSLQGDRCMKCERRIWLVISSVFLAPVLFTGLVILLAAAIAVLVRCALRRTH